jgi:thiol-disulfide isomerase/thioredoxin
VLGNMMLAGLCCCLVTSCKQADDGFSPVEPPPPASLLELFGQDLLQADGTVVGIETIESKTLIAIYFAAPWCPVCTEFTPVLLSFYDELIQANKSFEVVLVSYVDTAEDMLAHMTDSAMPWLAIPFSSARTDALTQRYQVRFIPTLVVIDSEGNTITEDGSGAVVTNGARAYDSWLANSGK